MKAAIKGFIAYLMSDSRMAGVGPFWNSSSLQCSALAYARHLAALSPSRTMPLSSLNGRGPWRRAEPHSIGEWQTGHKQEWAAWVLLPSHHLALSGSIWTMGRSLTLSLCSMNSAKFKRVCVTSAMSCEVRANSMLRMSSSCWSSFSSDQQDTKAALKRSLKTERGGERCQRHLCWGEVTPVSLHLASLILVIQTRAVRQNLLESLHLPCPIWQPLITEDLNCGKCD